MGRRSSGSIAFASAARTSVVGSDITAECSSATARQLAGAGPGGGPVGWPNGGTAAGAAGGGGAAAGGRAPRGGGRGRLGGGAGGGAGAGGWTGGAAGGGGEGAAGGGRTDAAAGGGRTDAAAGGGRNGVATGGRAGIPPGAASAGTPGGGVFNAGCCGPTVSWPMQITVHDGRDPIGCHGYCWLVLGVPLRSISGICASWSEGARPWMLSGRFGPMPSGLSRCTSPSGGGGPVIGGRSTGMTPVA